MKEKVNLIFDRYRDVDGNPTCAINFVSGETCEFYRSQRFGTSDACLFAPAGYNGLGELLDRRGTDGLGTLIPGKWCPLFKE